MEEVQVMDGRRFDDLSRAFARKEVYRRRVVGLLASGAVAVSAYIAGKSSGEGQATSGTPTAICSGKVCAPGEICRSGQCAPPCYSGIICSGQCCEPHEQCLSGRCTYCPSGVICSGQCCPQGETCVSGRCTYCPAGVICSGQCCPSGQICGAGGRCT